MTLILALMVVVLVLVYIYQLSRHVVLGLASLLAVELYHETLGITSFMVGRVHLDPFDIVSICLMLAGVIRTMPRLRSLNVIRLLAVCYMVLLAFSYMRGFYANGSLISGNEARGYIGPLLGMLYFLTSPADEKSVCRYTWMYLVFGAALCVIAALGAAGLPVGVGAMSDSRVSDARYLPATGGAGIAICGFLSLACVQYRKRSLITRGLPILYLATAIYLRHRTVWMMLLFGTLALLLMDRRLLRRMLPFAVVSVVAIASLAIYGGRLGDIASAGEFEDSATNAQTWEWRVNGWKELLFDQDQTGLTVTVGKPMGSGYWRIDVGSNRAVDVHPHNEYVNEYLRVGAIGALIAFLFTVLPVRRLWRLNKEEPLAVYPSASAWAVVVVSVIVFGITYDFDAHSFALVGIANAILIGASESEAAAESEEEGDWSMTPAPSASD